MGRKKNADRGGKRTAAQADFSKLPIFESGAASTAKAGMERTCSVVTRTVEV